MTMKSLLSAVLFISAEPAYSLDYRSESLEMCLQDDTTQTPTYILLLDNHFQ